LPGEKLTVDANGIESAALPFAWFGKLPSSGDFISRRMPYALQHFWDLWFGAGMEALKARNRDSGWGVWGTTPHWAFLLPAQPGLPSAQFGLWAPSCDRVGRNFPFLATTPLEEPVRAQLLPRTGAIALAWSAVIAESMQARQPAEQVDMALAAALAEELAAAPPGADTNTTLPRGVSPKNLPWPELVSTFDECGTESYWWSVPPAQTGFRAHTHSGLLSTGHFLALCS
jgi:type VI secretion system protein ImpM